MGCCKAILAAATDEHRALVARFFPGDRIESPAAWDLLFDIAARVAA